MEVEVSLTMLGFVFQQKTAVNERLFVNCFTRDFVVLLPFC